jgi:hypothetical protein
MNRPAAYGPHAHLVPLVVTLLATGCAGGTGTPSQQTSPSPPPSTSVEPDPSGLPDEPRFRFDCTTVDGRILQPLTSLDEVWASPDYLEVASCSVSPLGADPALMPTEEAAAEVAAPGASDPLTVVEVLLATCTRLTSAEGPDALPSRTLKGALIICPHAPHADLLRDELTSRGEEEA